MASSEAEDLGPRATEFINRMCTHQFKQAGPKFSNHQSVTLLQDLDAISRLTSLWTKNTCVAASFDKTDSGDKALLLAFNSPVLIDDVTSKFNFLKSSSKDNLIGFYLTELQISMKNINIKKDDDRKVVHGYPGADSLINVGSSLKYILEDEESDTVISSQVLDNLKIFKADLVEFLDCLKSKKNKDKRLQQRISIYNKTIESAKRCSLSFEDWGKSLNIKVEGERLMDAFERVGTFNNDTKLFEKLSSVKSTVSMFTKFYYDLELFDKIKQTLPSHLIIVKNEASYHAELKIFLYYVERYGSKLSSLNNIFIGISKLACEACRATLDSFALFYQIKIIYSGFHGKLYPGWVYPPDAPSCILHDILKTMSLRYQMGYYTQREKECETSSCRSSIESRHELKNLEESRVNVKEKSLSSLDPDIASKIANALVDFQFNLYDVKKKSCIINLIHAKALIRVSNLRRPVFIRDLLNSVNESKYLTMARAGIFKNKRSGEDIIFSLESFFDLLSVETDNN